MKNSYKPKILKCLRLLLFEGLVKAMNNFSTFLLAGGDRRQSLTFLTRIEADYCTERSNYALSLIYTDPDVYFETMQRTIDGDWVIPEPKELPANDTLI